MSYHERTGIRDLLYSRWHRPDSIRRFLGLARAVKLHAIDVDWCEACCYCSRPLALVETQEAGRSKSAKVTTYLGQMAGLPVYTIGYTANTERTDLLCFAVRQLLPQQTVEEILTPCEMAEWLEALRIPHFALRARSGSCPPLEVRV
jgi:hypothetical protein